MKRTAGGSRAKGSITASRRQFLSVGGAGTLGAAFAIPAVFGQAGYSGGSTSAPDARAPDPHATGFGTVAEISPDELAVFDPTRFLTAWNFNHLPQAERDRFYRESKLPDGRLLREYLFVARDREIEIAPGVYFPAWTYNDQVPGPTIRASRGDRIRIWFVNEGTHPHTIHFHGWHPFEVDGAVGEQFVQPAAGGGVAELEHEFGPGAEIEPWRRQDPLQLRRRGLDIYEFDADPMGLHLYHCHSTPLKRHIHKGLYGVFLVDPAGEGDVADRRPKIDPDTNEPLPADYPVRELVMVMNAFDTNFDGKNEVYAANTFGFHFMRHPIPVKVGELVRVYLVNLTEFDPVNSFHLHAGFFRVYRTGTSLRSEEYTDTVMMCQAERAILEFRFREGWPGKYMFHAHQSEFAELGWMAFFAAEQNANRLAERRVSEPAPDFALIDQNGHTVRLADYRGKRNVVLVFHLGAACAFCSDQIQLLSRDAEAIRRCDAEVLAISGDDRRVNQANAPEALDSRLRLLSDPGHVVASGYGTFSAATGQELHGTFLIDKAGRVRWKYTGPQPLMDTEALMAELQRMNGQG